MGLFDVFTGDPVKEAAEKQRQYLEGVQTSGTNAINTGLTSGTQYLQSGGVNARNALTGGYGDATGAVNAGSKDALSYLNGGLNTAGSYYDQARGAYGSLSALGDKYGGATNLALGALGVNGQAGTDAARSAFQAGPAYQFNMDQGIDAINRRRAAGGMLDSGNADRDAQKFGAGLASNEYDKWLQSLLGFTNPELGATSGFANGMGALNMSQAGLTNNNAMTQAQIANGRGGMLSDLASRYGGATAGSFTGEGQSLANLGQTAAGQQVNLGLGLAQPYSNTYQTEANAEMAGSKNLWGAGLAVAQMAAGMPPTSLGSISSPAGPTNAPSYPNPQGGTWYG